MINVSLCFFRVCFKYSQKSTDRTAYNGYVNEVMTGIFYTFEVQLVNNGISKSI